MAVASQYPKIDIPEIDLFSFLFRRTKTPFPDDKVIYQDADDLKRRYTFQDIRQLSVSFGQRLLKDFGLRKGERVALITSNDIDYPVVVCGILWAGGVVTPANPGYTAAELAYQLKDSGARLAIAHPSALDTVTKACGEVGLAEKDILLLGQPAAAGGREGLIKHWKQFTTADSQDDGYRIPNFKAKEDIAFLAYSSGTTGRPKGVMLTHYNMVSNVLQVTACEAGKLSSHGTKHVKGIPDAPPEGDKVLSCLPFFHIYGLCALVFTPMYNGIHTIVLSRFEITTFCRLIQDMKITYIYIVPPMALLLAKHPDVTKYDLSSVRMTNSGAAPLTKELQQAVFNRTGIRIKQGYGLSETSPTTHEQRWEDWNTNIGTIGKLQPNMEAKFCAVTAEDSSSSPNEDPQVLPAGETGELYVKGPNVFKGYWNNPAATATCLSPTGWFRTGDIGHVNSSGDFFITDRVKELIKYKGFQVPPAELEGYLTEHELVDDVVVVGVESRKLGTEVPRAYVVRKGGLAAVQSGDERRIVDWLARKVANHKKLRGGIKFVDAVPKSPSGKLLRRLIKEQAGREFARVEEEEGEVKAKL